MSRLTWLHLSDLHYGKPKDAWDAEHIQKELIEDLKYLSKEESLNPDLIFFTGDLAFGQLGNGPGKSLVDQYRGVEAFLDEIRTSFSEVIPKERIFLVPGNHDVNRNKVHDMATSHLDTLATQEAISDFVHRKDAGWEFVMERLADYRNFLATSGYSHLLQDEDRLIYGKMVDVNGLTVGVGGFNSVWSCAKGSGVENGHLRVGWDWQTKRVLKHLNGADFKIALFHHPLSWGIEPEKTYAEPFFKENFEFVLTGHEHRTSVNNYSNGHVGVSAYACYHRSQGSGYNICRLDFKDRAGLVFLRNYSSEDGGGWVSRNTPKAPHGEYSLENLEKWMPEYTGGHDPEPEVPPTSPDVSSNDDSEFMDHLQKYTQKAQFLHGSLPMVGFGNQLQVTLRIEDIYMPLHAVVNQSDQVRECHANSEEAWKCMEKWGTGREISIPEAFKVCRDQKKRGIVILGDPGSGKTTHLKRLLLWTLAQGHEEVGLPKGMIPLFLPLRELKSDDIQGFIQERLADVGLEMPRSFGPELLDQKPVLLLLDGLDEVRDPALRAIASRRISDFMKNRPHLHVALTSRFAGYTPRVRLDGEFMELHLRPLTKEQARAFIHTWYSLVEGAANKDRQQARALAEDRAADLTEVLKSPDFRARRVFEMTRNPLLLTNLCLVHRGQGKLPRTRGLLYKATMDVLLEFWKGAQGMEVRVDANKGQRLLQPVAHWMHQEENRIQARARELEPILESVLDKVRWNQGSAGDFLKMVRDDSGLLTGWGSDRYGFMHLGFQEYLTARHIRNQSFDDPSILKELAGHFGESWWQEVILLFLGLEEPSRFKAFMAEVVKLPAFAEYPEMVELCLDDAAEIDWEPFLDLINIPSNGDENFEVRKAVALGFLKRHAPGRLPEGHRISMEESEPERERDVERSVHGQIEYEMVKIPAGEFMMGAPEFEEGSYSAERPVHRVEFLSFSMGKYPVTNRQYDLYLKANPDADPPEYWGDRNFNGPDQPVVGVSWHEANAFAQWAGLTLPSESQWEYACRAGTQTRFYTGDTEGDLARAGWYDDNSNMRLHPIGEKIPNDFGLYDMHGNVWEWTQDHHGRYENAPKDGSAWVDKDADEGALRVIRGGAFDRSAGSCRSAYRSYGLPSDRDVDLGFRLVLPPGRQA